MIRADIDYLVSLEEISWRQKFKALFIKERDNYTRFFHRIVCEDELDILDEVVDFYKKLY